MGRLEGKSAVILGAAGRDNMGQVMARTFAREGARVMVAGRHEGPLREIAARDRRSLRHLRHHDARPTSKRWRMPPSTRSARSTSR